MDDLIKALKIVKKTFKTKPQKPKLTPKQFQQKAKVHIRVKSVINGSEGVDQLMEESNKLVEELVKIFIKQASEKSRKASASLKMGPSDSDEPDQSSDPKA